MNRAKRHDLYLQAFKNTAGRFEEGQDPAPIIKQLIVYGVKAVNTKPEPQTADESIAAFQFASVIKDFIGSLTPGEFETLFPIAKEYDGERWGTKDYFYTKDYISSLNPDEPIGENALEFMWEYTNWEITTFNVAVTGYLSDLRRLEGHLGLFEEFMASQGMETPNTFKNSKGEVMYVRHGKPETIKRTKQNHLKVIK